MIRYITPSRYRSIGLGVDLQSTSNAQLEALIGSASALVNSYCSAPSGHDFRGGSVTGEPHTWEVGNKYKPASNRVWPYHKPLIDATSLVIYLTNQQTISMSGSTLFIHEVEGYVEPISLAVTTAGVFGMSILPNIGLKKPVARVDYTYGWDFESIDEELAVYSGSTLSAANQFWMTDEDVALKKNGTTVDPNDYTINYTEGTILPDTYDPTATYTATYHYPLPVGIARATAIILSDLIGYANINASGLSGLSGIKVEEIELRQSAKAGFIAVPVAPAAQSLLNPYRYHTMV